MTRRTWPRHGGHVINSIAIVAVLLLVAVLPHAAAAMDGNLEVGSGAAVAGGALNTAKGDYSFVGAGKNNSAFDIAVVAGGEYVHPHSSLLIALLSLLCY